MSELSIAELEDEEGVTYMIGISSTAPESVREWFWSTDFEHSWNKAMYHAELLRVPADIGTVKVTETTKEELEELLDQ